MVGNETVHLHGGPEHGTTRCIESAVSPIVIYGAPPMPMPGLVTAGTQTIGPRVGQYSRVGNSSNFEWDGWIGNA